MTAIAQRIRTYWDSFDGENWNRFWFSPTDVSLVCFLRIAVGFAAFLYVLSHSADLTLWFGAQGMLPADTVRPMIGADRGVAFRPSYFYLTRDSGVLLAFHWLGVLIALAMTLGWKSRWTTWTTLFVVLSYVHRAPMITGQWEPLLTMALFYLGFAPTGARWAWDARTRNRNASAAVPHQTTSWLANFAVRMLQVHLAAIYLVMALNKLAGATWWRGDAIWWLGAYSESRLLDFTGLLHRPYVFSMLTHLVVSIEFAMAVLIWRRAARPILLLLSTLVWSFLALLTGLVGFCAFMIVLNLVFIPAETFPGLVEDLVPPLRRRGDESTA